VAELLRAYRAMAWGQVRSVTSYRASFLMESAGPVVGTAVDVLTVLVLFQVTRSLGGFAVREAMVVVGLSAFAFATSDLLVGNVDQVKRYIRTGTLDAVLVRPLGVLPQLIAMDMPVRKITRSMVGLAVLVIALVNADVDWTPARAVLVVAAEVAGIGFFAAIFVGSATLAFWWVESGEVGNAFTYGGREFTTYPISVYQGWFRTVFAYGLGFGFVSYYPALALLGRADPVGLPDWVGYVSPLVAVPAVGAAAVAWRFGIRNYRSTGS
jgi:ABC-2 type transport system permease protein